MNLLDLKRSQSGDLQHSVYPRPALRSLTQFKLWYTVTQAVPEGWAYGNGRVTEEMLAEHMPDPGALTSSLHTQFKLWCMGLWVSAFRRTREGRGDVSGERERKRLLRERRGVMFPVRRRSITWVGSLTTGVRGVWEQGRTRL
eukprot:3941027-Rhodomonas_salina.3